MTPRPVLSFSLFLAAAVLAVATPAAATCDPADRCEPSTADCKLCAADSFQEPPGVVASIAQGIDYKFIDSCMTVTVLLKHKEGGFTKVGGHFNALTAPGIAYPMSKDAILAWMKGKVLAVAADGHHTVASIFVTGKAQEWSNDLTQNSVRVAADPAYQRAVAPLDEEKLMVQRVKEADEALLKAGDASLAKTALEERDRELRERIEKAKKALGVIDGKRNLAGEPFVAAVSINNHGRDGLCPFLRHALGVAANLPCTYDGGFTVSKNLVLTKDGTH